MSDGARGGAAARGEMILYSTEDGRAEIQLRADGGTVWLTQAQMAELFQTSPQAITQLLGSIFREEELSPEATCKESLQVRTEGSRRVRRKIKIYNLDAILAVGYRVRSPRGVQFRRWATTVLREYLVKGFAMNDERLKDPQRDYFDELLDRIRAIRASEARFYRKVRDILALSSDYDPASRMASSFFARIQNKMLHAVTGHTAAELLVARSDSESRTMGLTTWKGQRVRKQDVGTSKNYLDEAEIRDLNLIVTMFLDTAELRASRRQVMTLTEWDRVLDRFLAGNELPILAGGGIVSAADARDVVDERYAVFDAKRRAAERNEAAKMEDITELRRIAGKAPTRIPG